MIKSENLPADLELVGVWEKLQREVSGAAGLLQNDLIGLERDLENGEQLNAVLLLMRTNGGKPNEVDETLFGRCIDIVNTEHNKSVAQCVVHIAKSFNLPLMHNHSQLQRSHDKLFLYATST